MQLALLKSRLSSLRRRRAAVRWATAWSATLLALFWSIAALFLLDWLLVMSMAQRVVGILIALGVTVWAFLRFTRPWLGQSEDLVDVALLVERHQHIDSDLVAALQFQGPEAPRWGSPQLESAVIEYVEAFSPSLNVFEGFTYRRFKRRTTALAVTTALLTLGVLLFPAYARVFADRMLLGNSHYPTDTLIAEVLVNGHAVIPTNEPEALRLPYGTPLEFRVLAHGVRPNKGRVRVVNETSRANVECELTQTGSPTVAAAGSDEATSYTATLPKLVNSVKYQVYLGDAWTDPLTIQVMPLPVVTVDLVPSPPKYATLSAEKSVAAREGTRQLAVIEGSDVTVRLSCANKPLQRAWLTIDEREYPLTPSDATSQTWTLAGPDSPLHRIAKPIRYAVQVEDADGLKLERPVEGYVRIRADRRPTLRNVTLGTVRVLPSAQQLIAYDASDDYGLSRLDVQLQIVRGGSSEVEQTTRPLVAVPADQQPKTQLAGNYRLDLGPLGLKKGDEIKLTLAAFDYRGDGEPKSSVSEPLVMKVTDLQGILAALGEGDEKAAQDLNTIIELGAGDKR